MRVESQGMATLSPETPNETPAELGVRLEYETCESVHITEAVPARGVANGGCSSTMGIRVNLLSPHETYGHTLRRDPIDGCSPRISCSR